ncbi:MAG: RsmE family RNA methyltransferase, partial [Actinomycetota bacterium]
HHLQRVRRLRVGEPITVADGLGRWRPYTVADAGRGRLVLRATGPVAREPVLTPGLAVAFALGKGAKPELVVADLTELGVDRIVPFRSVRSVVRWDDDRARSATVRLRRVAREAAMQCRRSRLPVVDEPVALDALATTGTVVIGSPTGVAPAAVPIPAGGEWLALVGAEGGLSAEEIADLTGRPGTVEMAVGPHVLRTETAAVALAAVLAARRSVSDPTTLRST